MSTNSKNGGTASPTGQTSWRVDETYVKIKGRWTYLYRAVDKQGKTVIFCSAPSEMSGRPKRFSSGLSRATADCREDNA